MVRRVAAEYLNAVPPDMVDGPCRRTSDHRLYGRYTSALSRGVQNREARFTAAAVALDSRARHQRAE